MTKISAATELLASGVTSAADIDVALADGQSTLAGKRMSLRELHKTIAVTYVQSGKPSAPAAPGFYSVQTRSNKGLYWSGGVGELIVLTTYPEDQDWPVV